MNGRQFGTLFKKAMSSPGLEYQKPNRWYRRSTELTWVVQPEKDRYAQRYDLMLGCLVNEWSNTIGWDLDSAKPKPNQCHFYSNFVFLDGPTPSTEAGVRFNDHAAYFTMAFTLDHEIIDDIEREAAIESAAAQIHATFGQVDTLQALARMVGAKKTNSFVHRDLKRVIVADRH